MKETKSIQVYPDNSIINQKIELWNCFGWELLSNQRQQEKRGDMIETFAILTFQREKSEPWYPEVSKIEHEFYALCDEYQVLEAQAPQQQGIIGSLFGLFGKKKKQAAEAERVAKMEELDKKINELAAQAEAIVNGRN